MSHLPCNYGGGTFNTRLCMVCALVKMLCRTLPRQEALAVLQGELKQAPADPPLGFIQNTSLHMLIYLTSFA